MNMSSEDINIAGLPNNWVNCGLLYVNEKSQLRQYVCTICLKNNDNQINEQVYTSHNPYEFWKHFFEHMPGTETSDILEETGNSGDSNALDKNKITESNILQVNLFQSSNTYNKNSTSTNMDNYDELEHISKYMRSCSNEAAFEISDSEESVDLYFGEIPQEDIHKYKNYERKPICDELQSDYPEIISCINLKKDVSTELGFEKLQIHNADQEKLWKAETPEMQILIEEKREERSSDETVHAAAKNKLHETNTDVFPTQCHKEISEPNETTLSSIQKQNNKTHENNKEPPVIYSKTYETLPTLNKNIKNKRPDIERTEKSGSSSGRKRKSETQKVKVNCKAAPTLKLINLWDINSESPKPKPAPKQQEFKGCNKTTNLSVSASQNTRFLKFMSKPKKITSNNRVKRTSISSVKFIKETKDMNIEYLCIECAAPFKTERARETHMKRTHMGLTVDVLSEQQEQAEKNKLKDEELLRIKQEIKDNSGEEFDMETEQQQQSLPDLMNEKDHSSSKSVADGAHHQPVKEQKTPLKFVIPKRKARIQHDTKDCMPLGGLSVVEQQQANAKKLKTISLNLMSPEASEKMTNKQISKKGCNEPPEVALNASDQHQNLPTVLQQLNENVEKNPIPKKSSDFTNQPSYLRSNTKFQKSFNEYKQYEMIHQLTTSVDSRKQIPIPHDDSNRSQYKANHGSQFSCNNSLNASMNMKNSQNQVFGQTQPQQQQPPPQYPQQPQPKYPSHQQQPQYRPHQQQPRYPPGQQQPSFPLHQQQPIYQQEQYRCPQQQSQFPYQQTPQYIQLQYPTQHYHQQQQTPQQQQGTSYDFRCQNDLTTQYAQSQCFPNSTYQQNRYRLPQDFGPNLNFQKMSYEPIQELPQYNSNSNFYPNNSSQQFIIRNQTFYAFSQQGH